MLKKLFLVPYFGTYPSWIEEYKEHIKHLQKFGYDWYFLQDLDEFYERVEKALGFTPKVEPNTSLSHNYRTAFGLIFADILTGYDFWGITDLDCVYGNPTHFITDDFLTFDSVDIWSNHHNYICGPWTLFRNSERINTLFRKVPRWEELMQNTQLHPGRWTEVEYSQVVDKAHEEGTINRLYTFFQGKDPNIWQNLSYKNGELYDGDDEIMTFHFNRNKIWPL